MAQSEERNHPAEFNRLGAVEYQRLKSYLINTLVNEIGDKISAQVGSRNAILSATDHILTRHKIQLANEQREKLHQDVLNELVGFGPIQPLLDDAQISEIMVNGAYNIFYEKNSALLESELKFENEEHLMRVIDRILHPLGRRVDRDNPTEDAHLPDGSRVNVVIPPVAIDGPVVSIRKFLQNRMAMDDLIALDAITSHMAEFLRACVVARLNILITGGTSSGKTTMLNILSGFIPGNERIITIEDAVELQLQQRHVVRLETRPAGMDGRGAVTTRDLVRNALRMRPDRIVVGEVRSGEALDMLQSMNTGHSGSITTLHANTPRDAISRLETMAMMAGLELPLAAIRRQIASAMNLIVHQTRLTDGSRKTTQITEVVGMESDVVTLSDIFRFDQSGISSDGKIEGMLRPTGIRPMFSPRLEAVGYKLRGEIFGAGKSWQ